jgi:hypothetical protein
MRYGIRHGSIGSVDNNGQLLTLVITSVSNKRAACVFNAKFSVNKQLLCLSYITETRVMLKQFHTLSSPRESSAAEGVTITLNSCLVTVKHGRYAVNRVLYNRRQLLQSNSARSLSVTKTLLFKLTARELRYVLTRVSEQREYSLGIVSSKQIHKAVTHALGVRGVYGFENIGKHLGILIHKESKYTVTQRIIHYAVKLSSAQVSATL